MANRTLGASQLEERPSGRDRTMGASQLDERPSGRDRTIGASQLDFRPGVRDRTMGASQLEERPHGRDRTMGASQLESMPNFNRSYGGRLNTSADAREVSQITAAPARAPEPAGNPLAVSEALNRRRAERAVEPSLRTVGGGGQGRVEAPFKVGDRVEVRHEMLGCWVPDDVVKVTPQGHVRVSISDVDFSPEETKTMLRWPTKLLPKQATFVLSVTEAGLEKLTKEIFAKHATRGVIDRQRINKVAAEVTSYFGVIHCAWFLHVFHAKHHPLDIQTFWKTIANVWTLAKEEASRLPPPSVDGRRSEGGIHEIVEMVGPVLGQGAFGAVYEGFELATSTRRAVKRMDLCRNGQAEIFAAEVDTLCLLDHPNICRLHQWIESDRFCWLVMDFCDGGSLQESLQDSRGGLPEDFVTHCMMQVSWALGYMHDRGVLHMDVKPANVTLMPRKPRCNPLKAPPVTKSSDFDRPHVVLIDFGLAKFYYPGGDQDERLMGSPQYIAPEAFQGIAIPASDIFGLGVMTYELLTDDIPFLLPDTTDWKKFGQFYEREKPEPQWAPVERCSQDTRDALKKMLALNSDQRAPAMQLLNMRCFASTLANLFMAGGAEMDLGTQDVLEQLGYLPDRTQLYLHVARCLAEYWPVNANPAVQGMFAFLSSRTSGRLTLMAMAKGLENMLPGKNELAAERADFACSGYVEWTDFVACCLHFYEPEHQLFLDVLFDLADRKRQGFLVQEDLRRMLPQGTHIRIVRDIYTKMTAGFGGRLDKKAFFKHFLDSPLRIVEPDFRAQLKSPDRALAMATALAKKLLR